jgi:AraC family transcriptional regulator of adaptative response / DNA-3-methyladenine glycosylase II
LRLEISFPEARWLFLIIERVRRMFDLTADPREIAAHLSRDVLLSEQVRIAPGLRVPGCWDGFELAVRAILGQQISVAGASTLAGRLVQAFGERIDSAAGLTHLFPKPERLAEADVARIGLSSSRAETIRRLARHVAERRITFDALQDSNDFRSRLREIRGLGDWTVQYIAMRALGDPDAFPANDLGLMRAASMTSAREISRRAKTWRPWRAYAAMYLWQANGEKEQKRISAPANLKVRAAMLAG